MLSCCKSCISTEYVDEEEDMDDGPLYRTILDGAIRRSEAFIITGLTLASRHDFLIDFCLNNKDSDIALRIDVNFHVNVLSRNSRIAGTWGIEETSLTRSLCLAGGMDFEIQVFFKEDCISIAFNNAHIADFVHRTNLKLINKVLLRGIGDPVIDRRILVFYPTQGGEIPDVSHLNRSDIAIRDEQASVSEPVGGDLGAAGNTFLPLPYYKPFSRRSFGRGCGIIIRGIVSPNPKLIKVRLIVAHSNSLPRPRTMLLEIRFTENATLALNTFVKGKWTGEVRYLTGLGLSPGSEFELHIVRNVTSFQVEINMDLKYNYTYILNPCAVDTCCVEGDIKLISVRTENDILSDISVQ